MKRILKITSVLILSLFAATAAQAQENGVNSPFSRYGIGILSNQAQSFNQGMAGLAYGMRDGRELNFKNPASYSAIDSLSFLFDMGVSLQNGNLNDGHKAANVRNVTLDYISAGFRLRRGLGLSLGLMPISNIGYKMSTTGNTFDGGITGDITPTISYNGAGGLREAYVGLGYAPVKPISVGVNMGYLWGTMSHVATNSYSDANVQSINRAYTAQLRSFDLNAGLQWRQRVSTKHAFVLGLAYGMGHDLGGDSYFFNQRISSGSVLAADTLKAEKAWSLPQRFGGGLTWEYNNRLRIGADYTLQQWSKAKQPMLTQSAGGVLTYAPSSVGYEDVQRFTVGAEYIPDPQGLTWAGRVRYRAGFSYGNTYARVLNDAGNAGSVLAKSGPKSYLATLGVALPIINIYNNRSFLDISAQYERIEPQVPGQLTENYFRLNLGISFNERWFQKWKVQ